MSGYTDKETGKGMHPNTILNTLRLLLLQLGKRVDIHVARHTDDAIALPNY